MKEESTVPQPFIKNCYLCARKGETIFHQTADAIIPLLDGYAIIPCEEYDRLIASQK